MLVYFYRPRSRLLLCGVVLGLWLALPVVRAQKAVLTPDSGAEVEYFGFSVAADGDAVLVGAPFTEGPAASQGLVFVFRRTGSVWIQEAELLYTNPQNFTKFGWDVDLDGDRAVVGTGGGTGAYLFERIEGAWEQVAHLLPVDVTDTTAESVSLDGERVAFGLPLDGRVGCCGPGSVFVYRREGSAWVEEQKLLSSTPDLSGDFGKAVALDGDWLLAGELHLEGGGGGQVHAFQRNVDGVWEETDLFFPSDPTLQGAFGAAVALEGSVALVGAPGAGAAYVFRREGAEWVQEQKLVPPNRESFGANSGSFGGFGGAVELRGDVAIVGAQGSAIVGETGKVYVFRRPTEKWELVAVLRGSDFGVELGNFGAAVALSETDLIVGSPLDETGTVHVFGYAEVTSVETAGTRSGLYAGVPYPNPMSRTAVLPLTLPEETNVRVVIYDVLGREVAVVAEERMEAGRHALTLDGARLASGIYLVRATCGIGSDARVMTSRITLIR